MSRKLKDIELRSEEVQEILTKIPSWMIRWGTTFIFGILLLFILISWFVKYPDTIDGEALVTSQSPPVRLVNKTSGTLESILVKEGDFVKKGDPVALFENSIDQNDIEEALRFTRALSGFLTHKKEAPLFPESLSLGEYQENWNELKRNYFQLLSFQKSGIIELRKESLTKEIALLRESINLSNDKVALAEKQLERQNRNYTDSKKLAESGAISGTQLKADQQAYENAEVTLQNLKEDQIQKRIRKNQLIKDLQELDFDSKLDIEELEVALANGVKTIESLANQRKMSYVITAPISGEVIMPNNLVESQYYESGIELFVITNTNDQFKVTLTVPQAGAGKIKKGQRVRIALADYPEDEFGYLEGEVISMAKISGANGYKVNVRLISGLKTSYGVTIESLHEITGTGTIITEKLRLTERIFDQFRKIFQ